MHCHLTQTPPSPATLVPGLSPGIANVVMKALAKAPEDRFASAEAFQNALRDALFGADLPRTATVALPSTGQRSAIDPSEFARVETLLAAAIGPIAKRLAAKLATRHSSVTALCADLAEHIPDPAERATFLRAFGMGSGLKPAVTTAPSAAGRKSTQETTPLSEKVLENARKALAIYLGPMAGVMVKHTAKRVRSFEELRDALAAEIPDERSQKEFLDRFRE
jgi:serine/threonine-protein kinase